MIALINSQAKKIQLRINLVKNKQKINQVKNKKNLVSQIKNKKEKIKIIKINKIKTLLIYMNMQLKKSLKIKIKLIQQKNMF